MSVEDANPEPSATDLTNSERLLQHLPENSLAARLVQAASGNADQLKKTLTDRLEQVRKSLGGT